MSGVRFGIHTDETLLHAAAYMDFQTYVRSLQSAGHGELALQVWDSVAEVVHFPPPDEAIVDVAGLPAMRRMPCLDATCERCHRGQGGFKFPWVGVWCRRAVLVSPGVRPDEAWRQWHEDEQHLTHHEIHQVASGKRLEDVFPPEMDAVLARTAIIPGCARRSLVFRAWREWQNDGQRWRDPRDGPSPSKPDARADLKIRAQASLRAWLHFTTENPRQFLPDICVGCGKACRRTCTSCIQSACVECENCAGPPICCGDFAMGESTRLDLPALDLHEDQGRLLRHLVARWAPMRPGSP